MQKVTQEDIARRVQVSQSAVSAVLNGNPTIRVNPGTRKKILDLANELNYQARRRSRALVKPDNSLIGVVDFSGISQAGTEKLTELVDCIQELGFSPLVFSMFWFSASGSMVCKAMMDAGVQGVILQGLSDNLEESCIRKLQQNGIPVVAVEGKRLPGLPRVEADKASAFYQLTRHLLNLGHRKLTLQLTWSSHHRDPSHSPHTTDAILGFQRAVDEAGVGHLAEITKENNSALDGMSRYFVGQMNMDRLLQKGDLPDAVLCTSDPWAIGALRACREAGITIPGDLAITGFNGEEQGEFAAVPLTTAAIPSKQMARLAVNMLLSRIASKSRDFDDSEVVTLPCNLIIRQSCGSSMAMTEVEKLEEPALA